MDVEQLKILRLQMDLIIQKVIDEQVKHFFKTTGVPICNVNVRIGYMMGNEGVVDNFCHEVKSDVLI